MRSATLQQHGDGGHWGNRPEVAARSAVGTGHSRAADGSTGIGDGQAMGGGALSSSGGSRPLGGSGTALNVSTLTLVLKSVVGKVEWQPMQTGTCWMRAGGSHS